MRRRRWRSDGLRARGIAEIVGTLMLILIVVAAAVALAAFVASYENQYLSEQANSHDKSLENIQIISIDPVLNPNATDEYASISVVIGSLDIQNTSVEELTMNGQPIAAYTLKPLGSQNSTSVCILCGSGSNTTPSFQIAPDQQDMVSFNLQVWNAGSGRTNGLFTPYVLAFDQFIDIGVYTLLGNDFTRAFYAPTAVIQLGETTQYVGGSSPEEDMLVLNGANSPNPPNATTVWWSWTFSPQTTTLNDSSYAPPLLGEEVLVPQSLFPVCSGVNITYNCPASYTITLTVQDSDGLFGTSSVAYNGFVS